MLISLYRGRALPKNGPSVLKIGKKNVGTTLNFNQANAEKKQIKGALKGESIGNTGLPKRYPE